jgi:hypothetical protein
MKYLFKYIYKGHDRGFVSMREASKPNENEKIDEIEQYREARWVTPPEALWRIYGFELSKNSPPFFCCCDAVATPSSEHAHGVISPTTRYTKSG